MIVLVNPITKQPTAFAPGDEIPYLIFEGPYQNVAEVSDEWVSGEIERLGRHILENYELWSRYPDRIAEAISAEREACAKIADTHHGACQQGCDAGEEIAAAIRTRGNV